MGVNAFSETATGDEPFALFDFEWYNGFMIETCK